MATKNETGEPSPGLVKFNYRNILFGQVCFVCQFLVRVLFLCKILFTKYIKYCIIIVSKRE